MTIKELFGHAIGVAKFPDFAKFYNWLTKTDHTFKGDVTFEGGADFTDATVTGISGGSSPAYYAEPSTPPSTPPVASGVNSIAIGDGAQALNGGMLVIGLRAGSEAIEANNSNFIGNNAGFEAFYASNSNFIGNDAGYGAVEATYSNFLGTSAGNGAAEAQRSNFLGTNAGYEATNAAYSNFLGDSAGGGALNAAYSNFLGAGAGYGAIDAGYSIFIGKEAGIDDEVNNDASEKTSILIGNNTSTGGFSNSIALGRAATNTAANQLIVGSTASPINDARIIGTGGFVPPVGTTLQRPGTPTLGMIRFNTDTAKHEGWDGTTWNNLY